MANAFLMSQSVTMHMIISPISKLVNVWSPEVFIHGIPWEVEVSRVEDNSFFAVYLHCTKKDDTSNWALPASATIALLPFSDKKNPLKKYITPYVFNRSNLFFGLLQFIQWDELLKDENMYVKNDSIQMKIEITAEDPDYLERSILKWESIDKSCDCGSHATFRLTVTNVENLMAVRSPRFNVRSLPWDLTVYKCQKSTLGIMLSNESTEEVSCNVKMTVKLLSNKDGVDPIEASRENKVENSGVSDIEELILWDVLLKPNNGFVNNNAITLEVEIKADKPKGNVADVKQDSVTAKRYRLECSICLEVLENQDMSTTPCGHLFCTVCITKAIKKRDVCPMCQKAVQLTKLKRFYLPVAK